MPSERDLIETRLLHMEVGDTITLPSCVVITRDTEVWHFQRGEEKAHKSASANRCASEALKLAREARNEISKLDATLPAA
jgi:hypothetical protein